MKRSIAAFLVAILLCSVCATSFAEEFTFHKGLKFGMSSDEVVKFEEDNNDADFSKTENKLDSFRYFGIPNSLYQNCIYAVLGFTNQLFGGYFLFDKNDALTSVVFCTSVDMDHQSSYNNNVKTLCEKYGDSISDENGYKDLPNSSMNAIDCFNIEYTCRIKGSSTPLKKYEIEKASQWLVQVDDGYVEIFALLVVYSYGFEDRYTSIYSYALISEEDYSSFIDPQYTDTPEDSEARNSDL